MWSSPEMDVNRGEGLDGEHARPGIVWFPNSLAHLPNLPGIVWFPNPLAIGLFQSQMGTLSSHHGQQTTADERRNTEMCGWQKQFMFRHLPCLHQGRVPCGWINVLLMLLWATKNQRAFTGRPPVNVLPISSYCSAFYNALTYSHCLGKCFTEVVKWMHCPWVQGVCGALEWKPQVAK